MVGWPDWRLRSQPFCCGLKRLALVVVNVFGVGLVGIYTVESEFDHHWPEEHGRVLPYAFRLLYSIALRIRPS
jgi:hypothetical protein